MCMERRFPKKKRGYWLIVAALSFVAGITAISILEIPKGIKVYSVQSGSMRPTLPPGSLIIVKSVDYYRPGDIITFKAENNYSNQKDSQVITHRLIEVREAKQGVEYLTKGEANAIPDVELVKRDLVFGKVIFSIPLLGFPVAFTKTLPGLIFLIVVPATIIIYNEILNIKREVTALFKKKRKVKKKEKKEKNRENLLKLLILLLITCLPGVGRTNSYFIDLESIANNSISSGWWLDQTPPESSIVSLEPSYVSLTFEISYFAEDSNTSGVKQVNLYYHHTFDTAWQFFGTDVPDVSGNGSFDFTSPAGDGIYWFKTQAEDNAGNKEEKDLPDGLTQVDTQKPVTMLSLGEFGSKRFSSQEILANGNFEDSSDPDFGWTAGGAGDHQVVNTPVISGNNSFLIGFKNTDLSGLVSLPAKDFLFQDIDLPAAGSATLSFWYRLNSEDVLNYDWFHALVLEPLTNNPLAKIAHDGLSLPGGGVTDLGWKEVTHSLADFLGKQIRLYFEVENTGDRDFKTWAYLDDIRVTKGENNIDPTTKISLEATDASGSGVLLTEYKIDDGSWEEYTAPFNLDQGGHDVAYRSEDINGLVEEEKTISLTASPSTDFLGVVLNRISVRPSGSDKGSSGVPLDGEWVELWNNSATPIDVAGWVLYDADENKLPILVSNADNNGNLSDAGETVVPAESSLKVYRNGDSDFTLNDNGDTLALYTDYKTSGGVLVDSFSYGAVGVDDKTWQRVPDGTGTWTDPGKDLAVNFGFREDKKAVWFETINVSSFSSLKYEIVYDSEGGQRGITGEIKIDGQDKIRRDDLLLGTCSSLGQVCVYDQDLSTVRLKVILIKEDGNQQEIQKEILY